MGKKFFIETFGCQMNVLDSEKAAAILMRMGYELVEDPSEAEILLINTCAVREKPEEKVYHRIRQIRHQRKRSLIVGIMGCVAQAQGSKLRERGLGIDLVVGTQRLGQLPDLLSRVEEGEAAVVDTGTPNRPEFLELAPGERQREHVAYVTIMEGCDKFCSFCVVPFTRGRERSRSPEKILAELRALAERGVKEVHLLGQNVNAYGRGKRIEDGERMTFASLLRHLAEHSGILRIKFTTSHPSDFTADIVKAIEEFPNLCNWVHLPPQAGSDRILALMNRGYTASDYLRKVDLVRSAKREITLTGDIIVGFPGESEDDFKETLKLVERVEFDGLFVFKYSPRPGTPAAVWKDQVPEEVKTRRLMELDRLQRSIQMKRHEMYIGKRVEVLVEGRSAKSNLHATGHTSCHIVVNFEDSETKLDGSLVKVEILKVNPHSLFGRVIRGDL